MSTCTGCGTEMSDNARFCSSCGQATTQEQAVAPAPSRVVDITPKRAGRMAFRTFLVCFAAYVLVGLMVGLSTKGRDIPLVILLCFGTGAAYAIVTQVRWKKTPNQAVESKTSGTIWTAVMVIFAFSGLVTAIGTQTSGTSTPTTTSVASSQPPTRVASASSPAPASLWDYSDTTDEMTNQTTRYACVKSTNKLYFDFPYSGGSASQMCFRRKGNHLDAYIQIQKGQFMCRSDDCVTTVKFDDGPLRTFGMSEADSGNSNILFFNSEPSLLASMRKSKHVKVQAKFYKEGRQVMEFDTGGLDWK